MNCIEIKDVSKRFTNTLAVDNLTLSVPKGSIYGFIGPNGSGKSTTLRMLLNIIYPDQGDIKLFGEAYNDSLTNRIGYLPEERGLYKNMKVGELLHFFGKLKKAKNVKAETKRWLEKLELSDWIDKKVNSLSKGMSQKVQFIASVIAKPELVILDEPFSGLDPVNREVMKEAVLDLKKEGVTVVFSTHDMDVAEKMCDSIFMIYKGKKVLDGTLESIQDIYGSDIIKLSTDRGVAALEGISGIGKINDFGNMQEVRLEKGVDPQEVLRSLTSVCSINNFEIAKPSLHDIFVRIARPQENLNDEVTNVG